jgi:hypothetical protein
VNGGQELVQVAQVVFPELAGGVAHGLKHRGNRRRFVGHSERGAGLTDSGEPGADRQFASDKVCPARRAAGLCVVISKQHALRRELVEIRRLTGHDPPVVGADIRPADVITHDEDDIGFFVCCPSRADCE